MGSSPSYSCMQLIWGSTLTNWTCYLLTKCAQFSNKTQLACALGGLARPFARSPVPRTGRKRAKTIRQRPKSKENDQKLPKSLKTLGKRPKSPSPVRPSLRAGQFVAKVQKRQRQYSGKHAQPKPKTYHNTPANIKSRPSPSKMIKMASTFQ